jgi:DNA polymerase III epsilon subunit-like protein
MIFITDVETTGLPLDYRAPSSDSANWPHMVQLAMMLKPDLGHAPIAKMVLIIKPEGYTIPEEVSKIHGITTEKALAEGVPLAFALGIFWGLQQTADYLVGHNIGFDGKIIRAAAHRAGVTDRLTKIPTLDTMTLSTKFCNLPGKRGPKWPKLTELHTVLFGHEHKDAHDAMGDVEATERCLEGLYNIGVINDQSFEDAVTKHKEIERMVKEKAERESKNAL